MFSQIFEGHPQRQKCFYYTTISLAALLALLVLVSTVAVGKSAGLWGQAYPERTISVTGTAEVQAVPDIAVFTFEITEEADSVEEAQNMVSEKIDAVMEILDNEGIDEKDIKTTNYSANPQYDWLPPVDCNREYCGNVQTLRNYRVSQTTQVKVRASSEAGDLVGKIGNQNVTYISGLSFTIDDTDILEEEALGLAIEAGREKAESRAKALGMKLGKVIDFYEMGDGGYYPEPYFGGAHDSALEMKAVMNEAAIEPQFAAGESTISKSINLIFEIK